LAEQVPEPLAGRYRGLLFDCDGVLYLRDQVVPAAPAALTGIRRLGARVVFVTNNSAVAPRQVADKLTRLGIEADPVEVVTSALATVRMLGGDERVAGTRILVVGGPGLTEALAAAGAHVLGPEDDWRAATIVVVGFDPELTYDKVRRASLAIAAGARFVGSNPDASLPSPDGPWPGAGATLALLQTATDRVPEVAGKPQPALLEAAAANAGDGPYLMVGDRADTDLAGATRLGWDTVLVLTGVTRLADLPDLPDQPTWVLCDLAGLLDAVPPTVRAAGRADLAAAGRLLGTAEPHPDRTAVAVAGEQVVGAVAWSSARGHGELSGPVVDPAARGALVGSRLVMTACAQLRAAGASAVTAAGDGGHFLTRLGFEAGADGRMRRPLAPASS
jgi:glycerol-1-phosphatase